MKTLLEREGNRTFIQHRGHWISVERRDVNINSEVYRVRGGKEHSFAGTFMFFGGSEKEVIQKAINHIKANT